MVDARMCLFRRDALLIFRAPIYHRGSSRYLCGSVIPHTPQTSTYLSNVYCLRIGRVVAMEVSANVLQSTVSIKLSSDVAGGASFLVLRGSCASVKLSRFCDKARSDCTAGKCLA